VQLHWINVYSALDTPPSGLFFVLVGLAMVAIMLVVNRLKEFSRDSLGETVVRRGTPGTRRGLWFAIGWTVLASVSILGSHWNLRATILRRGYVEVTGQVQEFNAADLLRKKPERWTVSGHRYQISYDRDQPGFDTPGVVKANMYVRIWDVGGHIARLDTARQ
jgi:hypothetical protein